MFEHGPEDTQKQAPNCKEREGKQPELPYVPGFYELQSPAGIDASIFTDEWLPQFLGKAREAEGLRCRAIRIVV